MSFMESLASLMRLEDAAAEVEGLGARRRPQLHRGTALPDGAAAAGAGARVL